MKKLPVVEAGDVWGKKVLVRGDVDVEGDWQSTRWKVVNNLIEWLQNNKAAKVKVIGHKGGGLLAAKWGEQIEIDDELRLDAREEENDAQFAQEVMKGYEVYINEAFATSHRKHASIDALPRLMNKWGLVVRVGPRFAQEVEELERMWQIEGKKVLIVGGAKAEDKLDLALTAAKKFDVVLVGGRLPLETSILKSQIPMNIQIAMLQKNKLDIDEESLSLFRTEIAEAKVVVMAGPVGRMARGTEQVADSEKGTKEVMLAVANSQAYKVIGGGDTEMAARKFGVIDKMNWVSVGGGAMLIYLTEGTLIGLQAVM